MKKGTFNFSGLVLLIIGAILMASGIINGEHIDVFKKAIRVCLECIGIG